ncbi:hypothetical protein FRC05_004938 [Tulasnella sp. 425]|nr:hypothetical protein FRC05_004938 [Tulasnella sp. 425]
MYTGDESPWLDPSFHNNDDDDEEEPSAPIKACPSPAVSLQPNQPQRVRLEPDSQGSSHLNAVYVNKKAVDDSSAVAPQTRAPNGIGVEDLTAQVSGTPIPDADSIGARRLGVPSPSTSNGGKPYDSDAALSAPVSGTASKPSFLRNLRVKVKAGAASAKRSPVIARDNLDRFKNVCKRRFKDTKGKGRAVASDEEDVGDVFEDDDGDIDKDGFSKRDQETVTAESRWGGGLALYGASTSRDTSRQFSGEEWRGLEQFQALRSGTTAPVEPQLEETPIMDLDLPIEVIYQILLDLAEHPQPPPVSAKKRPFGSSAKRGWKRLKRVVSGLVR